VKHTYIIPSPTPPCSASCVPISPIRLTDPPTSRASGRYSILADQKVLAMCLFMIGSHHYRTFGMAISKSNDKPFPRDEYRGLVVYHWFLASIWRQVKSSSVPIDPKTLGKVLRKRFLLEKPTAYSILSLASLGRVELPFLLLFPHNLKCYRPQNILSCYLCLPIRPKGWISLG